MNLQEKAVPKSPLGVYFHVPFCPSTCDFCGFYQEAGKRSDVERYLEGVELDLAHYSFDREVGTVFWGGGTPSLLKAEDLVRLGQLLLAKLGNKPEEWTVELAPSTVKKDKVAALLELGVTRFSLGVQSFQEATLEKLGRRHNLRQIYQAIEWIREGGCKNLNLDLIIAIPGQELSELEADLEEVVRIGPEHISTYCLTFEEDTGLYVRLLRGDVKKPSEELELEHYESVRLGLKARGYEQYEVSNYARPGFACWHNLNTWAMGEWIGIGPSASSQFAGRRYTQVHDLDAWLAGLHANEPRYVEMEELTPRTLAMDSLIFGLRCNRGVDLVALRQRYPELSWKRAEGLLRSLADEGLLLFRGEGECFLSDRGRLLADRISVEILDIFT